MLHLMKRLQDAIVLQNFWNNLKPLQKMHDQHINFVLYFKVCVFSYLTGIILDVNAQTHQCVIDMVKILAPIITAYITVRFHNNNSKTQNNGGNIDSLPDRSEDVTK